MIVIASAVLGAILGAVTARKRGGAGLDIAQYAVASAIACALIGVILTLIIHRVVV